MSFLPVSSQHCAGAVWASRRAFTLIELLAVMTIILLLAGLILNIAGSAQYKAAFARATAEIKQMETAMESYKVDNGAYPRDPVTGGNGTTDNLNAQSSPLPDPASGTLATNQCVLSSQYLFTQLSGVTASGNFNKAYITFLPNQLATTGNNTVPTAGMTYIIDPFGFSYCYSTSNQYAQDQNNATPPANVNASTYGYNPTFDLWSTGGYSPTSGKTYPTTLTTAQYNTLWAKNW